MVRNATVATAAPGPRASPMAASRAGSPRLPRSALNRASAGKIRATTSAAAIAMRPGSKSRRSAVPSPRASCSSSATPPTSATATTSTAAAATRSSAPIRAPSRCGSDTVTKTRTAATTAAATATPSPTGDRTLSPSTSTTGAPASPRHDAGDRDPRDPAENDAGNRNRAALDPTEQPQLPPLRSEPGEPPSRGLEVAAHAACGEDREREQKRRAFPADEEQTRPGDVRRALDLSQLVHGPLDRERRRALASARRAHVRSAARARRRPRGEDCRGR